MRRSARDHVLLQWGRFHQPRSASLDTCSTSASYLVSIQRFLVYCKSWSNQHLQCHRAHHQMDIRQPTYDHHHKKDFDTCSTSAIVIGQLTLDSSLATDTVRS